MENDLQLRRSYESSPPCKDHTYVEDTAYCIWSVIESQSPISIFLVSFQRNEVQETCKLDHRLRYENEKMTQAVHTYD